MLRNLLILASAAIVIALPFVFRQSAELSQWKPGDPELIIITPHNEAIRYEFGRGFSAWHAERYGAPVKIDWRAIGGTSEIMRYLAAEYASSFRAWFLAGGNDWPVGGASLMLDRRFKPDRPPEDLKNDPSARAKWETQRAMWTAFREHDDPDMFSAKIDIFFGGGEYDHNKAARQGLTVVPWAPDAVPPDLLATAAGAELIPERLSGETWRTTHFYGAVVSTFGIVYNLDRLQDLGVTHAPAHWRDLTDPAYFGQLGVADPTKSGSIAKTFEMIIHQACFDTIREAGFSEEEIVRLEEIFQAHRGDALPDGVPSAYQEALEAGWLNGVRLVQRIGANARYFTDSSSKIPIDVSMGDAAVGLAIDFYGRYQAETSRSADGTERMKYITPHQGSSVSADPMSLLRGAPNRELAQRFMEYVLSDAGQRLWNYRPGTPGGPAKFALRRLPIRRDFYPSADLRFQDQADAHAPNLTDPLHEQEVNPYRLAETFTYHARWTGAHFNIHRDLIRAMCLDSGEELRAAWKAILEHGGPDAQPDAVALVTRLPDVPEPVTWQTAPGISKTHRSLDYMRQWTIFFRTNYREAQRLAEGKG